MTTHSFPGGAGAGVLFLAASVPHLRDDHPDTQRYAADARPEAIEAALTTIVRAALDRDLRIVFGGHPAITPLVLAVVESFVPTGAGPRVCIEQSEFFRELLPPAAQALAEDVQGRAVLRWTERRATRAESLTALRTDMLQTEGLVGAVFLGGLDGLMQEAELARELHASLPLFPLASTGGAAVDVLARFGGDLGHTVPRELLAESQDWPRVARLLLDACQP